MHIIRDSLEIKLKVFFSLVVKWKKIGINRKYPNTGLGDRAKIKYKRTFLAEYRVVDIGTRFDLWCFH